MPERFRSAVDETAHLCRELIARLATGQLPDGGEVERFSALIAAFQPKARFDPIAGTWFALSAAETWLRVAMDERDGAAGRARELTLKQLRLVLSELDDLTGRR